MLAEMFMLLDEDHDGVVDIDELRDCCSYKTSRPITAFQISLKSFY
jgi:Ca2+-binding EF-hand superfamily protein